jgi:hypothetical protein
MSSGHALQAEGIEQAKSLLHRATTNQGILASIEEKANYRRIWARDGIICGLAGLLAEDDVLIEGFKNTLLTLASHQGPQGQVPSNVKLDAQSETIEVSYGGLVGRVDPTIWFIIGVCNYLDRIHDAALRKEMEIPVQRCLSLLDAWEFNGRGLLYVPQGGDWADEFILSGYVLYDQLLRLWALRCFIKTYHDDKAGKKAQNLLDLIKLNFWPDHKRGGEFHLIHQVAYNTFLKEQQKTAYWLPTLHPGGYIVLYDTFANALALFLEIGDEKQTERVIQYGDQLSRETAVNLLPSFWPPVEKDSPYWQQLHRSYGYQFKNHPYEYHNGGVWPIVNGWWGFAMVTMGRQDLAQQVFEGINQLNKIDDQKNSEWAFYEYFHALTGKPGGTRYLSWSAAGSILLKAALKGNFLLK